jgi:hypothetical protein
MPVPASYRGWRRCATPRLLYHNRAGLVCHSMEKWQRQDTRLVSSYSSAVVVTYERLALKKMGKCRSELRRLYVVRATRGVVPRSPMGTVRIIATNARLHGRCVMNWRFSCPEKNGEEDVMKRCSQCGVKFGLVRHTFFRNQFCSQKCLQAYKLDLDMKRYWLRLVRAVQSPTRRQTDVSSPKATSKQKPMGPNVSRISPP